MVFKSFFQPVIRGYFISLASEFALPAQPETTNKRYVKYAQAAFGLLIISCLSLRPHQVAAQLSPDWISTSTSVSGESFGRSVSISGDTVIVGAYGSNSGGAAYVFVYNGEHWIEQAKLRPSDATADDSFGYSVSLDND